MTDIAVSLKKFYSRFAMAYPENLVPDSASFPYITYEVARADYMTNILISFQIWNRAENTLETDLIADKISDAIPAITGTTVEIKRDTVYEWYNPSADAWIEFAPEDFRAIAAEFYSTHPDAEFQWRQTGGKISGVLRLFRGNPFMQYRTTDETDIVALYGNVEVRSYMI